MAPSATFGKPNDRKFTTNTIIKKSLVENTSQQGIFLRCLTATFTFAVGTLATANVRDIAHQVIFAYCL